MMGKNPSDPQGRAVAEASEASVRSQLGHQEIVLTLVTERGPGPAKPGEGEGACAQV